MDSNTFVGGTTLTILHNGTVVGSMPAGSGLTYSIDVSSAPAGSTFKVLYYSETLGWVEYTGTSFLTANGHLQFSPEVAGTYAVVY